MLAGYTMSGAKFRWIERIAIKFFLYLSANIYFGGRKRHKGLWIYRELLSGIKASGKFTQSSIIADSLYAQ